MREISFQGIINSLNCFWSNQGCSIMQPLDSPVGAGTSHPLTFFGALSPRQTKIAYVQPCRRPGDGRMGGKGLRLQHYFQYQVLLKPSPQDGLDLFLKSLSLAAGFDLEREELQILEDNWENPSLGASGLGWEVRLNGLEIAQITYFQQMGGLPCDKTPLELTYGLERVAMLAQGVTSPYNIYWDKKGSTTYGDWYRGSEEEGVSYNYSYSSLAELKRRFEVNRAEVGFLLKDDISLPQTAYLKVLEMIHLFNLLEARRGLGGLERQDMILLIRKLSHKIAKCFQNIESNHHDNGNHSTSNPGYTKAGKL